MRVLVDMKFFHNGNRGMYMRNFIFGVEDSLVSTVGLLSGVAIAGTSKATIVLTGAVLVFVEAFSMGVGSLLSEHSVEEYARQASVSFRESFSGSVIMFTSYFLSGFISLFPYIFFAPELALPLSVIVSLAALFALGIIGGKLSHTSIIRNGIKMLFIGGGAIGLGVLVGLLIDSNLR